MPGNYTVCTGQVSQIMLETVVCLIKAVNLSGVKAKHALKGIQLLSLLLLERVENSGLQIYIRGVL